MKNIIKYFIIFCIFLFCLLIPYNMFFGDSIVNYGFSYAIRIGEVPYRDFNLVLPLFSPFLYALPLFIYNSAFTFYSMQALLLTFFFWLLEKQLSYKVYLFFFFVFIGYPLLLPTGIFPGYNFILFLLIIILIHLEEKKANDYLIGLIIGLSILTKHTIGIFLILPSLFYYYKDYKKLLKRLVGLLIPCLIFLIYLLFTKTLSSFIDLCILGLFDFGSKNRGKYSIFTIIIMLLCIIYFIYIFRKEKKISIIYLFLTILFIIPIFDAYHSSYFVMSAFILFLENISFQEKWKYLYSSLSILSICLWTIIALYSQNAKFISYPKYPLRYMSPTMKKQYTLLEKYGQKYDSEMVLFLLGTENYFYKINHNEKITYFDLPNHGNYGYDGFSKMKKRIDNKNNVYFIVRSFDNKKMDTNQQYYLELVDYIKKKGKLTEENDSYMVYFKE